MFCRAMEIGLLGSRIAYALKEPYLLVYHFQRSSPLKPLGQSMPNFIWSLLGEAQKKVYTNGPGHMTKMAAMSIYVKNLKRSSPQLQVLLS